MMQLFRWVWWKFGSVRRVFVWAKRNPHIARLEYPLRNGEDIECPRCRLKVSSRLVFAKSILPDLWPYDDLISEKLCFNCLMYFVGVKGLKTFSPALKFDYGDVEERIRQVGDDAKVAICICCGLVVGFIAIVSGFAFEAINEDNEKQATARAELATIQAMVERGIEPLAIRCYDASVNDVLCLEYIRRLGKPKDWVLKESPNVNPD